MPRKKARRVIPNQDQRAAVRVSAPRLPVVVHRTATALAVQSEPVPAAEPAPILIPGAIAPPTHRLFWAWYNASVDTVRCALDVHSVLVRQMIQVSPVSVAMQYPFAFHVAFQAFTPDHDRALA